MSQRSRSASERAEARRRARYAASGRDVDDEGVEDVDESEDAGSDAAARRRTATPGGNFLTRLFPPAPPLPGKPDPLAGFGYSGPLRGFVGGLYLLWRNPRAWVVPGVAWGVSRLFLPFAAFLGIVASLVSFGALIVAGWIGWQRPWLFGLMASALGILMYAGIWAGLVDGHPNPVDGSTLSGLDVFPIEVASEVFQLQPLFGVVAGWYGGYLRRRMSATSAASQGASRRRR